MFIEATSPNWQFSLSDPSKIVEGGEDIAQCIYTILSTVKGTDPLRPTFGSDVYKYIDQPMNTVLPAMVNEVYHAVEQWEKRIELTRVRVIPAAFDKKGIQIEGIVVASAAGIEITVTL